MTVGSTLNQGLVIGNNLPDLFVAVLDVVCEGAVPLHQIVGFGICLFEPIMIVIVVAARQISPFGIAKDLCNQAKHGDRFRDFQNVPARGA